MTIQQIFKKHANLTSLVEGDYEYMMDEEEFTNAAKELIGFHVTQALKQASESADANVTFLNWLAEHNESLPFEEGTDYEVSVINSSILDSYDLNLIKWYQMLKSF